MSVIADAAVTVSTVSDDSSRGHLELRGQMTSRRSAVHDGGRGSCQKITGEVTFVGGEPAQIGVTLHVGTMVADGMLILTGGDVEQFAALLGVSLPMAQAGS
ncbi:hypothetical protein IT398_00715 [Candidatus Nomurabacteria bacterium]|nr:hypothetical protein [Candidatus Nomurabacteria bacterium]